MTAAHLIAFEQRIAALFAAGKLPFLIHLSGGNEAALLELFGRVHAGDWVFSTHRNHYHYLLTAERNGVPRPEAENKLEALIAAGQSMFVYDRALNFCCSAILAGTCGLAAGVAWANREGWNGVGREPHVWCFLGDGAEDEGHFYEAVQFVEGHGLPCTFVIEDNDRSVETTRAERRGGGRMTGSRRWADYGCVERYEYAPTWPHGGAACKTMVTFDPAIVAQHAVSCFLDEKPPITEITVAPDDRPWTIVGYVPIPKSQSR